MEHARVARRPTVRLDKKLHDEIGFALRKYQRAAGARKGSVQHKVCQMLASLHDDLLVRVDEKPAWQVRVITAFGGQDGLEWPAQMTPPPGLDLPAIDEACCNTPHDEEAVDMNAPPTRANVMRHSVCETTPIKEARGVDSVEKKIGASVSAGSCFDVAADAPHIQPLAVPHFTESSAELTVDASLSPTPLQQRTTPDLTPIGIRLCGGSIGKQRELRMVEDLITAASKILISKGFHSVESGIQILA